VDAGGGGIKKVEILLAKRGAFPLHMAQFFERLHHILWLPRCSHRVYALFASYAKTMDAGRTVICPGLIGSVQQQHTSHGVAAQIVYIFKRTTKGKEQRQAPSH